MTKVELAMLGSGMTDMLVGMETDLLGNIGDYLATDMLETSTAKWKIKMLANLGSLTKKNIKTIAEYAKIQPEMQALTLEAAAIDALKELQPDIVSAVKAGLVSGEDVTEMQPQLFKTLKTWQKSLRHDYDLVNTTMAVSSRNVARKVINKTAELAEKPSFNEALNKAAGKTVTGAESRQAALRQCVSEMCQDGIPAIKDKAGRNWSPEAYSNMCIRTTNSNVANDMTLGVMDELGQDVYEVSSHAGARPLCAPYQGKLYSRSGKSGYITDVDGKKWRYEPESVTSYGKPAGLFGINCGHKRRGVTDGLFSKTYAETEDDKKNAEDYQRYQKQRELERKVRASKRECSELSKLGTDSEEYQNAVAQLKQRENALKGFCKENDLKYKPNRTATYGYGHSEAGKATAAFKKQVEAEKAQLTFDDIPKGRGSGSDTPEKHAYKQSVHKVGTIDVSDEKNITETMKRFENKYSSREREYCLVISEKGDVYLARGAEKSVDTTELLGKSVMKGSWNSHNHPPGTGRYTFSIEDDIPSFWDDGSYCMRAADDKFTYEVIRSNEMPTLEEFKEEYYKNSDIRWKLLTEAGKSFDEVATDEEEIIMEATMKAFNIDYRRWKNDKK